MHDIPLHLLHPRPDRPHPPHPSSPPFTPPTLPMIPSPPPPPTPRPPPPTHQPTITPPPPSTNRPGAPAKEFDITGVKEIMFVPADLTPLKDTKDIALMQASANTTSPTLRAEINNMWAVEGGIGGGCGWCGLWWLTTLHSALAVCQPPHRRTRAQPTMLNRIEFEVEVIFVCCHRLAP